MQQNYMEQMSRFIRWASQL